MQGGKKLRVLVVEDDPMYQRVLGKAFAQIPNTEVVATVGTLEEARVALTVAEIDLVTIDVVLGKESGIDLLTWMMTHAPRAVSAVLTAGSRRDARQAVDALLLGASTLVLKPEGPDAPAKLVETLAHMVSDVRGEGAKAGETQAAPVQPAAREVLAVGASTGGPVGVVRLLRDLPASFGLPVLIVQHMPAIHIPYYVELLARESRRTVHVAEQGMLVTRSHVYVAGGTKHMEVTRQDGALRVALVEGPDENFCCPAVDPLFRSVARVCGKAAIAVVLSGMGMDGAHGARALRDAGAPVLVQDRPSSVVWGMPGAVVAMRAATQVVNIADMANTVRQWVEGA